MRRMHAIWKFHTREILKVRYSVDEETRILAKIRSVYQFLIRVLEFPLCFFFTLS